MARRYVPARGDAVWITINPQARNFFEIVAYLQKKEGLRLRVRTV